MRPRIDSGKREKYLPPKRTNTVEPLESVDESCLVLSRQEQKDDAVDDKEKR